MGFCFTNQTNTYKCFEVYLEYIRCIKLGLRGFCHFFLQCNPICTMYSTYVQGIRHDPTKTNSDPLHNNYKNLITLLYNTVTVKTVSADNINIGI